MFYMPSGGELLAVLTILAAIFVTAILVVLKLCGVLLLSWGWILAPVPVALVLVLLCVIIRSI